MNKKAVIFIVNIFLWSTMMASSDEYPEKIKIEGLWKFKQEGIGKWYQADVPGCVHTDLIKNELIPDPFFGTNEKSLQWIGEKNWVYETTFNVPGKVLQKENVELVFEGLDTYTEISLNDSLILRSDNMFRTWRINCKNLLKEESNRLSIRFKNVFNENLPKYKSAPFELQAFSNNDQADVKISMYSRKAQFHYGWDWGPRLITCGIWRPACIEAWNNFKIDNDLIQQKNISPKGADILSIIQINSNKDQKVNVLVSMDGLELLKKSISLKPGMNKVELGGHIKDPKLWWTNGLGKQYLYSYNMIISDKDGNKDEYSTKIGIRSLEVVREKDKYGTSMYIKLNGVPVFMKGANYIPQDNFQNRVTDERYEYMIRSAAEVNMNMLRIWGGGIYENEIFYELCDRYGILVWQELMFACAMYPGNEEFVENVKQEVIDNVYRIRNHACIALYCGNNENEVSWYQWGWKNKFEESVQKVFERKAEYLFSEAIPSVLKEADPARYYHPTSPIAGYGNISNNEGDIHYWGVWHGKEPFEKYSSNIARFVSEYGFQSYPELSTIVKYAEPEDRHIHSEVMLSHQRCQADERRDKEYGNRLINEYMDRWYHVPKDFESYLYVGQVLQAEGVKTAMEAHRRAMPYCMGSLFWQIDDCWPVASWSSIDYYGRWKALHYTARRSYAPILISPEFSEKEVKIYIVTDGFVDKTSRNKSVPGAGNIAMEELDIYVKDFNGNIKYHNSIPLSIKPNTSEAVSVLEKEKLIGQEDESRLVLASYLKKGKEILAENFSYFKVPKELRLDRPIYTKIITETQNGYSVELSANTLVKNVYLACNDDKASYSDNYFDLLPGAVKIIEISTNSKRINFENTLKIISLVDSYQ